ncbi:DUF7857 domain-containing protein [Haladaptatus salinisoli]|uniref:DUF7857 domain-containing protein n=1 Tax=Haladaptatus salinisoli TaxID=2884876 RepID=UPI001D0AC758|nr:hypothetical protein [Haladaptatus salinisoli]
MVTLRWSTDARCGRYETVTVVELMVENPTETPVRVRVGNRLDGEVWPPRTEGVPEAGWDSGGFEGVVGAGDRRSLGYASRAEPVEPPAEIVWTERAAETRGASAGTETTVPAGAGLDGSDVSIDVEPTAEGVVRALGDSRPPADAVPAPAHPSLPTAVESWLSAVETHVERGEALGECRRALRAVAERVDDLRARAEPTSDEITGGNA